MKLILKISVICILTTFEFFTQQSVDFDNEFQFNSSVSLDETVLIGKISFLDLNSENEFIVTDQIGQAVYFFNNDGKLLRQLDVEACHPGFNMRPIKAKFNQENEILMLNGSPWGFRFDSRGNCIGGMHRYFTPPIDFIFYENNDLASIDNDGNKLVISRLNSEGKLINHLYKLDLEHPNLVNRIPIENSIVRLKSKIYFITNSIPYIYMIDNDKKLSKIEVRPLKYSKIEKDLSSNLNNLAKELKDVVFHSTITHSLFVLNEETLLIQYKQLDNYQLVLLN